MGHQHNNRFGINAEALSILRREGIGWAHDIESRTFRADIPPGCPGPVSRLFRRMRGGV